MDHTSLAILILMCTDTTYKSDPKPICSFTAESSPRASVLTGQVHAELLQLRAASVLGASRGVTVRQSPCMQQCCYLQS